MDTLVDRINEGMTTEADAQLVARMIERMAAYEQTLRRIAVHATGEPAMLATRTMAQPMAAYYPGEVCHGCDEA